MAVVVNGQVVHPDHVALECPAAVPGHLDLGGGASEPGHCSYRFAKGGIENYWELGHNCRRGQV